MDKFPGYSSFTVVHDLMPFAAVGDTVYFKEPNPNIPEGLAAHEKIMVTHDPARQICPSFFSIQTEYLERIGGGLKQDGIRIKRQRKEGWYWIQLSRRDTPEPAKWMPEFKEWKVGSFSCKETELFKIGPKIEQPEF